MLTNSRAWLGDHTKALSNVLKAGINCYMTDGTATVKGVKTHHRTHIVKAAQTYTVGPFAIYPFETEHDAVEPVGYLISYRPTGEKLLYATDTFYLRYSFRGVHYLLIECNYVRSIARARFTNGEITKNLYDRLMTSHFSLDNLKDFLAASDLTVTRQIVLLHMSKDNSDERRMVREVRSLTNIKTTAAVAGLKLGLDLHPF